MPQQKSTVTQVKPHGGKRAGAGRKRCRGQSVVVRIPESYAKAVKALITELDALREMPSKHSHTTEWEYLHLDGSEDGTGSATYQINVRKY